MCSFVAEAALCEPSCADFSWQAQHFVHLHVADVVAGAKCVVEDCERTKCSIFNGTVAPKLANSRSVCGTTGARRSRIIRKLRQVKSANTKWGRQSFCHSQHSEPIGMRASAPRSQQAGGREWQWRMSRRNSVPSVDVRHIPILYKEVQIDLMSHLFHTGLARNRTIFAMTQRFSKLGNLFGTSVCQRVPRRPSFGG